MSEGAHRPRLVLVGPPGAGKSTVAALVGKRLGVAVCDTDVLIEAQAGKPIADIFVDEGEPQFRALEREVVAAALADCEGVVAVGGGAVLDPTTRELLAQHTVVFLDVGLTDAVRRVGLGVARPLLLGNVRAQLKALLDARRPCYAEVATVTVSTDGKSADEVAAEVAAVVQP